MGKTAKDRWWKSIPFLESILSFLEFLGIWKYLVGGALVVLGGASAALAWLGSLPPWAIFLVVLGTISFILVCSAALFSMYVSHQSKRINDAVVKIDREALADEIQALADNISTLYGEYRAAGTSNHWPAGDMSQEDIFNEAKNLEAKLIERYYKNYEARVQSCIRRARKVLHIEWREHWKIAHGVTSQHQLTDMIKFLAMIADDVRNPAPIKDWGDSERDAKKQKP